jgi:uncharacterized protein (DUF1800 family)
MNMTTVRKFAVFAFAGLALAACSGESGDMGAGALPTVTQDALPEPTPPTAPPPPNIDISITMLDTKADTVRFLSRATFGGTKADIDALTGTDAVTWLQAEFAKPPTLSLPTLMQQPRDVDGNFAWGRLSDLYWDQMIKSDDQLRQRMVFALSQIVVYSDIQGQPQLMRANYQDILSRNAFGNYRDLLQDVTYSPAMAEFLTYMRNRKGDPEKGRMPDENYAREILQLFSIGLIELNMDGTPKLGADGREVETFDNDDIIGLARIFTGLAHDLPEFWAWPRPESVEYTPLKMFQDQHSPLEKTFLGTTIPADTLGDEAITRALDTIFEHPNVAPFVSRQLIQRFTQSSPSPAYIKRVATAFENGVYVAVNGARFGTGERGDLEATLAAVLLEEQLYRRDRDNDQIVLNGKIREPILRFTHWARTFDLQNIDSGNEGLLGGTMDPVEGLGQHPMRAPSVFNYYRPGYIAPSTEAARANMTAPEFQITNESSSIGYLNFMTDFAFDRGWQPDGETPTFVPNYSEELAYGDDMQALVEHLDLIMTGARMPLDERDALADVLDTVRIRTSTPEHETDDRFQRVAVAVALVANSPAYSVTW